MEAIKLSMDVTKTVPRVTSLGVVARDHGDKMVAMSGYEAMACRLSLELAVSQGFDNVILESDCRVVVGVIKSGRAPQLLPANSSSSFDLHTTLCFNLTPPRLYSPLCSSLVAAQSSVQRCSFPLSASHEVSLPSQPGVPVQLVAASQSLSKPELKSARVSGEGFWRSVGSRMVVLVVVGYVSPRRRCGRIRWRRGWRR
ncbi:hypothetical protein Drorol1_Dr00019675 [Drosera rotundifolia]